MDKPNNYEGYKINKDPQAPTSIFDVSSGTNLPVPGQKGQVLKLKNDVSEEVNTEDLEWGDVSGSGGTVSVKVVGTETIEAGQPAEVENIGTDTNVELMFSIPRGETGKKGETGPQGPVGPQGPQGEQGPKGENATFPTGTSGQILRYNQEGQIQTSDDLTNIETEIETLTTDLGDLGNEQGTLANNLQKLEGGKTGQILKKKSDINYDVEWSDNDGSTVSVNVGTTQTGSAGSEAQVINSGTSTNVVLDFIIPQGVKGDTGETGPQGQVGPQGPKGENATFPTAVEGQILVADSNGEFQATDDLKQTTQNITALQEEVQEIKNGPLINIEGGTIGQALIKKSNVNYDYGWMDVPSGGSTHKLYRIQLNTGHIDDDAIYRFDGEEYKDIKDNTKWTVLPGSDLQNILKTGNIGYITMDSYSGNKAKSSILELYVYISDTGYWTISTNNNMALCEVSLNDYTHIYKGNFVIYINPNYKLDSVKLYYYETYGSGNSDRKELNYSATSDSFLYFWN